VGGCSSHGERGGATLGPAQGVSGQVYELLCCPEFARCCFALTCATLLFSVLRCAVPALTRASTASSTFCPTQTAAAVSASAIKLCCAACCSGRVSSSLKRGTPAARGGACALGGAGGARGGGTSGRC
jgi:hypothetical protein